VALAGEILPEKILVVAARIAAINPSPMWGWTRAALLFSPRPRRALQARPISNRALIAGRRSTGAEGIGEMRQLSSLLRAAPSRIARRLKLIVAIAAASLPSAGA
jgi:hypothetical protein